MSTCWWGLPKPKYESFITHKRGALLSYSACHTRRSNKTAFWYFYMMHLIYYNFWGVKKTYWTVMLSSNKNTVVYPLTNVATHYWSPWICHDARDACAVCSVCWRSWTRRERCALALGKMRARAVVCDNSTDLTISSVTSVKTHSPAVDTHHTCVCSARCGQVLYKWGPEGCSRRGTVHVSQLS